MEEADVEEVGFHSLFGAVIQLGVLGRWGFTLFGRMSRDHNVFVMSVRSCCKTTSGENVLFCSNAR
jgi:hypothetical protein